jgi:hypothetical protein
LISGSLNRSGFTGTLFAQISNHLQGPLAKLVSARSRRFSLRSSW